MDDPTTLGEWRDLVAALKMEKAVEFLNEQIAQKGCDEKVLKDSSQMLYLLISIETKEKP